MYKYNFRPGTFSPSRSTPGLRATTATWPSVVSPKRTLLPAAAARGPRARPTTATSSSLANSPIGKRHADFITFGLKAKNLCLLMRLWIALGWRSPNDQAFLQWSHCSKLVHTLSLEFNKKVHEKLCTSLIWLLFRLTCSQIILPYRIH